METHNMERPTAVQRPAADRFGKPGYGMFRPATAPSNWNPRSTREVCQIQHADVALPPFSCAWPCTMSKSIAGVVVRNAMFALGPLSLAKLHLSPIPWYNFPLLSNIAEHRLLNINEHLHT